MLLKTFFKKDIVKKTKRQAIDWEKIFAKHIPGREVVARIHKKTSNSLLRRQPSLKKKKKGKRIEQTLQRKDECQKVCEKMLNITSLQGNAR